MNEISFMLFSNFIVNKNIIQIHLTKMINVFKQQIIHVMLSIDRIIDEIEKQHMIFVNV